MMPIPLDLHKVNNLKDTVSSITEAMLKELDDLGVRKDALRKLIATREQLLIAAIDEHAQLGRLAAEKIAGMHEHMNKISEGFEKAQRPTPLVGAAAVADVARTVFVQPRNEMPTETLEPFQHQAS